MMPHVYPPSISTVTRSDLANTPGYYRRLSNSFGYLNKQVRPITMWPPTSQLQSAPDLVQQHGQCVPQLVVAQSSYPATSCGLIATPPAG